MRKRSSILGILRLTAQPSLRGLVVSPADAEGTGTLYPWTHVTNEGHGAWHAWDDEGRPLKDGTSTLLLQVRGEDAHRTACRAQRRAFRLAWKRHELSVTERYGNRRWDCWIMGGMSAAFIFVMWVYFASGIVRLCREGPAALFGRDYLTLFWTVAFLCLLFLGVLIVFPVFLFIMLLTKPFAVKAVLDCSGIQARMPDGTTLSGAWNSLKDIRWCLLGRLRFCDGRKLWIPTTRSRTAMILRMAEEEFLPETAARNRKRSAHTSLRLVAWWVLGAVLAAVMVHIGPPHPTDRMAPATVFGFVMVTGAAIVAVPLVVSRIQRSALRRAKRRRQKQRARERDCRPQGAVR